MQGGVITPDLASIEENAKIAQRKGMLLATHINTTMKT